MASKALPSNERLRSAQLSRAPPGASKEPPRDKLGSRANLGDKNGQVFSQSPINGVALGRDIGPAGLLRQLETSMRARRD